MNYFDYFHGEYKPYLRISPFTNTQRLIIQLNRYGIELEAVKNNNNQYIEVIKKLNTKVGELEARKPEIQPGGTAFYEQFHDGVYFLEVAEILVSMPRLLCSPYSM